MSVNDPKTIIEPCSIDDIGLRVGSRYVMLSVLGELMELHAKLLLGDLPHARLLEIGFGLGVFSKAAQKFDLRFHTILELHPELVASALNWRDSTREPKTVDVVEGAWQDVYQRLGEVDAIMYDPSPPLEAALGELQHFVRSVCIGKLKSKGRFSFFCNGSSIPSEVEELLKASFRILRHERYSLLSKPPGWTLPSLDFLVVVWEKVC